MNDRLKKVLFIAGFLLVSAGIGYVLYAVFFKPILPSAPPSTAPVGFGGGLQGGGTAVPPVPGATTTAPGALVPGQPVVSPLQLPTPAGQEPRTKLLSDEVLRDISASSDGGVRSYNPRDGKFYRLNADGTMTALSDQSFNDVDSVTWAHKSDKAVLSFPDGSKIVYDFKTNKQATLPKHWEDFDFSPDDNQLAAKSIGNNETNRFLVIANADGTGAQPIQELGENQDLVHVSWSPSNQVVAYSFTGDPIGYDRQAIVMIGQHQENFKNLVVEGRGFIPAWSPSGNNLLYSVYNSNDGYRPSLWISGANGDAMNANRRNLSIQTWADKCAWQNENVIICAVPQALEDGAGLQRSLFDNVPDSIYRIDLASGQTTNLGQPDNNPSINNLIISADGRSILFNDRITGRVSQFAL